MGRHGRHEHRCSDAGVHSLKNALNGFVPAYAKDCGTKDPIGVAVDHDLHEAERLALFAGATNLRHRALADANPIARRAGLLLGETDAAEGRIDEETVARDPVAYFARRPVENIGSDDFVIVVAGVCKRTSAAS